MKPRNLIQKLILVTALTIAVQSRKYDIEEESVKLYGEDLNTVVRRFRKTPDYLKILKDKRDELEAFITDVALQTLYYQSNKLFNRVSELFPPGQEKERERDHRPTEQAVIHENPPLPGTALRGNIQVKKFSTFFKHPPHPPFMRAPETAPEEEKAEETTKTPVEALDSYSRLSSSLTLQERNMFKDLGFEAAGQCLHSIIKSVGAPGDDLGRSTVGFQQTTIDQSGFNTMTTPTAHEHEIISTQGPKPSEGDHSLDDTFLYRYRASKRPAVTYQKSRVLPKGTTKHALRDK